MLSQADGAGRRHVVDRPAASASRAAGQPAARAAGSPGTAAGQASGADAPARVASRRPPDGATPATALSTRPSWRPGWPAWARVLQRELARADAGDGLTRARLSALALLVLGGPRTLGDLAAAEHVRPPTMTRLVHAMEADGLVTREPHPSDGRSIVIRATPQGEAHLGARPRQRIVALARAIEALDDAERRRLAAGLDIAARDPASAGRDLGDAPG